MSEPQQHHLYAVTLKVPVEMAREIDLDNPLIRTAVAAHAGTAFAMHGRVLSYDIEYLGAHDADRPAPTQEGSPEVAEPTPDPCPPQSAVEREVAQLLNSLTFGDEEDRRG